MCRQDGQQYAVKIMPKQSSRRELAKQQRRECYAAMPASTMHPLHSALHAWSHLHTCRGQHMSWCLEHRHDSSTPIAMIMPQVLRCFSDRQLLTLLHLQLPPSVVSDPVPLVAIGGCSVLCCCGVVTALLQVLRRRSL